MAKIQMESPLSPVLSKDALRVLRDIYERGLNVLWSYRTPHPQYDDEETMSYEDWDIVHNELGQEILDRFWMETRVDEYVHRKSLRGGIFYNEVLLRMPDGSERVGKTEIEISFGSQSNEPDRIIQEYTEIERDGHWVETHSWESPYLMIDEVPQSDFFEYEIGLTNRYSLKPQALELIGESV